MKRLIPLILALACFWTAGFAEETATPTPKADSVIEGYVAATPTPAPTPELPPLRDDPVLLHIVEIAHRIDILAESKLFTSYVIGDAATQEQIDRVSRGDHTRPEKVFHLDGNNLIAALFAGADPAMIPDFTRTELLDDLVGELPELLWGRREETELYLLSNYARYKIFALEGAQGCGLFVLLYKDAVPVVVTWTAYNDCMKLAAFFMPDDALAAATDAEAVAAWFASAGMPEVHFEEVPLA